MPLAWKQLAEADQCARSLVAMGAGDRKRFRRQEIGRLKHNPSQPGGPWQAGARRIYIYVYTYVYTGSGNGRSLPWTDTCSQEDLDLVSKELGDHVLPKKNLSGGAHGTFHAREFLPEYVRPGVKKPKSLL